METLKTFSESITIGEVKTTGEIKETEFREATRPDITNPILRKELMRVIKANKAKTVKFLLRKGYDQKTMKKFLVKEFNWTAKEVEDAIKIQ